MPRATVTMERERIQSAEAAAILGVQIRTVQALALRGELPDAARIGGIWTFGEAALRNWIKERTICPQDRRHQNTRTGGAAPYGRGSPLQDENSVRALEQARQRLRNLASQR